MREASAEPAGERRPRDWRIYLGLAATVGWLVLGVAYIQNGVGWQGFAQRPAAEIGEFLDGAFAPLAFLWLVLGLFLQQSELVENNRAIGRQYEVMQHAAEQAEIQARAIAANELHARQDTFIELAKLVSAQLEVIAGMLFLSSQGPAADGPVPQQEIDELWSRSASGEAELFARRLIGLRFSLAEPLESWALFWSTPIRTRHSETFIASFERLLRAGDGCDPDGMIVDALNGTAKGFLHRLMLELKPLAEPVRG
jgi:hypothetical protein